MKDELLEKTIERIEALPEGQIAEIKRGGYWTELDYDNRIHTTELLALAAEVKRLREGLEHYADDGVAVWACDNRECVDPRCIKHPRNNYYGDDGEGNGFDHARKILEGE